MKNTSETSATSYVVKPPTLHVRLGDLPRLREPLTKLKVAIYLGRP